MAKTKVSTAIYEAVKCRLDQINHFSIFVNNEALKEIDEKIHQLVQEKTARASQLRERNKTIAELENWLSIHEPEEINLSNLCAYAVNQEKEVGNG